MEKYYQFAGLEFAVRIPEGQEFVLNGPLEPFCTQYVEAPHRFELTVTESLSPPEGRELVARPDFRVYDRAEGSVRYIGAVAEKWENAYIRASHCGKRHDVQLKAAMFPGKIGDKTILNAMGAEHLIAQNHGFVFHCSYIEYKGKAILFTAPSETGKSTQAELWRRYRGAEIINGDRAAVRLHEGILLAEGIPFSGSSTYCKNRSLPIAAIVYLGQAPKTTIRKIRGYEAFSRIWEGISVNTWDREDVERVSAVVQKTVEQISVFHMPCTPDEAAVIALEEALRKEEVL